MDELQKSCKSRIIVKGDVGFDVEGDRAEGTSKGRGRGVGRGEMERRRIEGIGREEMYMRREWRDRQVG